MTGQLVYTSAPRGLDSGTSGFCTVARSRDLPPKLAQTLVQISGYHPLPSGERPVAYSCVYVDDASHRVVSRVADAGLDHTGRSNKIAHHIVLSNNDLNATEPAAIFTDRRLFRERWDGAPAYLDEPLAPASIFPNFCRCDAWKAVLDDPGWGGYIASTVFSLRPVVLVVSPGVDVLRLFLEAIAVLPPQKRWDATFSTYFMQEFPGCRCQWKAVYAGTPEAENATRRVPQNALVVDLTRSVPPLDTLSLTREEENFIALAREAAKTGVLPGASAARSSVSTPTAPVSTPTAPVSTPTAPVSTPTAPLADVYAPTSPNVAVPRVAPSVNPDGLRERRSSKHDYTTETPRRVDSIPLKRKSRITFGFFVVWLLATLVVSGLAFVAGLKYDESQRAPSPDDVRQESLSSKQTSNSSNPVRDSSAKSLKNANAGESATETGATDGENSSTEADANDGENSSTEADANDGENSSTEADATDGENSSTETGANDGENSSTEADANDGENSSTKADANGKKPASETGATDKESKSETGATDKESKSETGATDGENSSPEADATKEGSSNPEPQSGAGATEQPQAAENPEGGTASPQNESDSGDVATAENNVSEDDLNDAFTTFKKKFDNEKIDGVYVVASATLDPATPANEFDAFATGEIADSFGKMFKAWYDSAEKLDFGAEIQLLVVGKNGLKFDDSTENNDSLEKENNDSLVKMKKQLFDKPNEENPPVYQLDFPLTFTPFHKNQNGNFVPEKKDNQNPNIDFTFGLVVDAQSPDKPRFKIAANQDDLDLVLKAVGVGARIRYYYAGKYTEWSTLIKPSCQQFGKTYNAIAKLYKSYPQFGAKDSELALKLSPFSDSSDGAYILSEDSDQNYKFWQGVANPVKDAPHALLFQEVVFQDNNPQDALLIPQDFANYNQASYSTVKIKSTLENKKMIYVPIISGKLKEVNFTPTPLSYAAEADENNRVYKAFCEYVKNWYNYIKKNHKRSNSYSRYYTSNYNENSNKFASPSPKEFQIQRPSTKWTLYLAFPSPKQDDQDNRQADAKRIRIPLATGNFNEQAAQ